MSRIFCQKIGDELLSECLLVLAYPPVKLGVDMGLPLDGFDVDTRLAVQDTFEMLSPSVKNFFVP